MTMQNEILKKSVVTFSPTDCFLHQQYMQIKKKELYRIKAEILP